MYWPADTVAMAQAHIRDLDAIPCNFRRAAQLLASGDEIRPELDSFIQASTQNREVALVLLRMQSAMSRSSKVFPCPTARKPFVLHWPGRKLPPLSSPESRPARG